MSTLIIQLQEQLNHLSGLVRQISTEQYTHTCRYLGNSTIGGHTRHVIELLQCAWNGYDQGKVDYINRQRNLALETDRELALQTIDRFQALTGLADKKLLVYAGGSSFVESTFYRELLYNIEHAIHHLALIKVAIVDLDLNPPDPNFGIAYSTIQYRKEKEQAS